MNIYYSKTYQKELYKIAADLPVRSGSILVTGASGLIGSCMVDVLLTANRQLGTGYMIYALGRDNNRLKIRFPYAGEDLKFVVQDITAPLNNDSHYDYIIHAASNADPVSYAKYPVETILTNVDGARTVLEYCRGHKSTRALLTSTFEVYGRHEEDVYTEEDFGKLDQNDVRSGYPESKRVSELLFRSYARQYNTDVVIGRLSSVYGPTMLKNDSKAHAQFLRNGLAGENIVLKSKGTQKRTYCYVMDAVSGLFTVLFTGMKGEAYNIANKESVSTISEVAECIAGLCGTKIVFDIPNEIEKRGFSRLQNCVLETRKLESLHWKGRYDLLAGIRSTIRILREMQSGGE